MSIELTPEQQQALDNQARRLIDPRTATAYILVPEVEYEAMRELLDDDRRERELHAIALRHAAARLDDDP